MLMLISPKYSFKTSSLYLNTSNVNVNPHFQVKYSNALAYLNTSNVNVNLTRH